jgi:integrase/recombinase XerD
MKKVPRARVAGPLAAHAEAFRAELARLGYTPGSTENQMLVMARVSRWLAGEGLAGCDLSMVRVEQMLAASQMQKPQQRPQLGNPALWPSRPTRASTPPAGSSSPHRRSSPQRPSGRRRRPDAPPRSASPSPRSEGSSAPPDPDPGPGDRGNPPTDHPTESSALAAPPPAAPRSAGEHGAPTTSAPSAPARQVLPLLSGGVTASCLVESVPPVAGWRDQRLVATLSAGEVAAILQSCDTSTATGARDYAVLLVLARLGLRAAEVAGLELDDVDWRAGEISVRGKGARVERLPLVHEVGEAIAAYLTGWRPRAAECRTLFLTRHAPWRQMHTNTISRIVRFACKRAGLPPVSAHRLRHALASELLRQGSTLQDIGQVLRHHEQRTTALYALGAAAPNA